ncbi:hypothetical protein BDW72DRAFT_199163 [Aspergillus terricola var. indicus]
MPSPRRGPRSHLHLYLRRSHQACPLQRLDDLETTTAVAAQHDIIINITLGYHSTSAQVLLRGLAQRREQTGRDVWYIRTSDASSISDKPRTTELGVIDTAFELGAKTLVMMSPIIYEIGTGLFNRVSVHTQYMKAILKIGHVVAFGAGSRVYDHVHIDDLADLYWLVVQEILERGGEALPTGKKGILFSATGRHSWLEYSQLIADAG